MLAVVAKDATRALSPAEFFQALPLSLAPRLPIELRGFDHRRGPGRLLKFDYGRPSVHFEVWHHAGAARLEVGLHMEGPRAENQRLFEAFRDRMVEVKGALPTAELEPWERGWCRLYETIAAPLLTDRVLDDAAARLARYISTLQPMLQSMLQSMLEDA